MPKLTKRLIDTTLCPTTGELWLPDDALPGFGVCFRDGRKAYGVRQQQASRQHHRGAGCPQYSRRIVMMSQLIPYEKRVVRQETTETVNARDLYAFLDVKQRFNDWIVKRIQQYGFSQDIDFTCYRVSSSGNLNPPIAYFMTFDMAKQLAMVERNTKGREARQYFIVCEKALQQSDPVAQFPELRAIRELLMTTAEARMVAEQAKAMAHEAELRAARAETKADMALDETRRMRSKNFSSSMVWCANSRSAVPRNIRVG